MASFIKNKIDQKGLINPIINLRTDICPHCKAQMIELYSFNNYPQNYRDAVDAYLRGYNVQYNQWEIRAMRCKSCKSEFVIDWTDGFPKPLQDIFKTNNFFQEFAIGI